jgi:hypothetical protein
MQHFDIIQHIHVDLSTYVKQNLILALIKFKDIALVLIRLLHLKSENFSRNLG